MENKTGLTGPVITGSFEKRAPGRRWKVKASSKYCKELCAGRRWKVKASSKYCKELWIQKSESRCGLF